MIPALRREKQKGLYEFLARPFYRASSRTTRAVQGNSVSKNKTNKQKRLRINV